MAPAARPLRCASRHHRVCSPPGCAQGPFPENPPQEGPPGEMMGIITIEDVIEELLGQEIVDETDTWIDNLRTQKARRTACTASVWLL